jgi:hypothetical protein
MAKVVGDIAVSVGADVSGLESGMKRASRSVKGFDDTAGLMAKRMAKVGAIIAGVGVIAVTAAARISSGAAKSATEIQNLSRLSGVGAEQFQKLAAAGDKVGFSSEKMADIFKDVNDKFGDFMATGAGPLKDFFDNIAPQVGVTADQFARLSGPEALQLYVTSLERAGVSQQQMTFYMEALASDATALVPLLRNNGTEMRRFGDEAARSGRILSNDLVRNGAELDRKFSALASTIRVKLTSAILENADQISALVTIFTEKLIPALAMVGEFVASVAGKIVSLGSAIVSTGNKAISFYDKMKAKANEMGLTAQHMFGVDAARAMGATIQPTRPGSDLLRTADGTGRTGPDAGMFAVPMIAPFPNSGGTGGGTTTGTGGGGGGGGGGDSFAAFQEQLMTQSETLEAWREEQLEKLRAFRDAKLATEEEYNDLEKQINKQHAEALGEINRRELQMRLQAVGTALGDMSSLMSSENDKMFKVGKAAALAQGVIQGYSSALSAWDKGMLIGGPPVAAAFTAASVLKTGALLSGIASASPRGGGGGGGGLAAAAGGSTPAPAPLQVRLDGINPQDLYSGSTITNLFDKLQDEAGDRGLSVSFAQ